MGMIFGFLWYLVRHMGLAGVLLALSWYGGATFGAPAFMAKAGDVVVERALAAAASALRRKDEPADEDAADSS